MEQNALALWKDFDQVIELVIDAVNSKNSKRNYRMALKKFFRWWELQGCPALCKAVVQHYRTYLLEQGQASTTINIAMTALRRLAVEAVDNSLLDPTIAMGITHVKGVPQRGVRAGNWLTIEQAQNLLRAPDITTYKGLRDRAILAVLLGAGLRRFEMAALTLDHVQQRDGRWAIVDLLGKGNRVRSVPIASWVITALEEWADAAGIQSGPVCLPVKRGRSRGVITDSHIREIVRTYAQPLGLDIAPHDLRRTYAKLAKRGGADLEQIQISLGHESIITTQKYLGTAQDFEDSPSDHLGLGL